MNTPIIIVSCGPRKSTLVNLSSKVVGKKAGEVILENG